MTNLILLDLSWQGRNISIVTFSGFDSLTRRGHARNLRKKYKGKFKLQVHVYNKNSYKQKMQKKKSSCIKTVKYRSFNDYIFFSPIPERYNIILLKSHWLNNLKSTFESSIYELITRSRYINSMVCYTQTVDIAS